MSPPSAFMTTDGKGGPGTSHQSPPSPVLSLPAGTSHQSPPAPSLSGHTVHLKHRWGVGDPPPTPFPLSGLGAPTLAEDELLHALLLLVGGLQTLSCALKEAVLFGEFGSQFQEFPLHGLSLGKRNRPFANGRRPTAPCALWLFRIPNRILQSSQLFLDWISSTKASKTLQLLTA